MVDDGLDEEGECLTHGGDSDVLTVSVEAEGADERGREGGGGGNENESCGSSF